MLVLHTPLTGAHGACVEFGWGAGLLEAAWPFPRRQWWAPCCWARLLTRDAAGVLLRCPFWTGPAAQPGCCDRRAVLGRLHEPRGEGAVLTTPPSALVSSHPAETDQKPV